MVAPIAALLFPAVLAIFRILADSWFEGGDAPIRVAGLLLFVVLPILYPILVIFMFVVGYILNKTKKFALKNLLIVNILASIPIAFHLGWSSSYMENLKEE